MYHLDEVAYAGYRIIMVSSHKNDDSLGNVSG